MAASSKLRIMISSRCNDTFPAGTMTTLTDIRKQLKMDIECMLIGGRAAFEVWINEDAPPSGGTWDSWEVCIEAVKNCDILLVISNGNSGWANTAGDLGICHAELMTGLSVAPAKVRLIDIGNIAITPDAAGERNKRFQDYVATQSLFRGGLISSTHDLTERLKEALHDAVIALAQAGVRDAAKGKFHSGAALDWSRLDFVTRQNEMKRVLRVALLARTNSKEVADKLYVEFNGLEVLVEPHAIPAAMTVGAAKEMVGQPFLNDYLSAPHLTGSQGGPLHIIACHKTATENQAAKLLGFPDATLVTAPFGVFVADSVQKVQFVFITNCRDESNTRHGLQRFLEWLHQTGEEALLAKRALSRARIVKAIQQEVNPT